MIGLALALVAGFAFGYLVVGPTNRSYAPRQYGVVVFSLAVSLGLVLLAALTLATLFAPPTGDVSIANLLIAQGFWTLYSASVALGAYVQQKRRARR